MTRSSNRWLLATAGVLALGMGACHKTQTATDAANSADASAATAGAAAGSADASAADANAASNTADNAAAMAPDAGASNTAPSQ